MSSTEERAPARRLPRDVRVWREAVLTRADVVPELARRLASDPGYDLHELLTLLDRGCPAGLAARILAPR
jgi:hypothetical protein